VADSQRFALIAVERLLEGPPRVLATHDEGDATDRLRRPTKSDGSVL